MPSGEPSHNISAIVHPDLQLELRAALFEATQTFKTVKTHYVAMHLEGKTLSVRMIVHHGTNEHAASGMTLLQFEENNEVEGSEVFTSNEDSNKIALHLDNELRHTKEQLRSVIEEYETAIEDLKVSNEEAQAVNEELRSTMEELETSKEELQSINEELLTVNIELKVKVDETAKAHDDLENFVAAT